MRSRRAAAIVATLLCLALPACGGDDADRADLPATASATTGGIDHAAAGHETTLLEGPMVEPRRAAPALALVDLDGRPFDIRDLRGRPALVTFVYASCPDVCPLIMAGLKRVRDEGGAAGRSVRVVAVSVDPEGDTPAVVRQFLGRQRLNGLVRYLTGTRPELEAVWARWGVATDVPRDSPELIEHTALIYGVTASGEVATAYPVDFDPAAIVRDLPRLAER